MRSKFLSQQPSSGMEGVAHSICAASCPSLFCAFRKSLVLGAVSASNGRLEPYGTQGCFFPMHFNKDAEDSEGYIVQVDMGLERGGHEPPGQLQS